MAKLRNRQGEITLRMFRFRYNWAAFNDLAPHRDLIPPVPHLSW